MKDLIGRTLSHVSIVRSLKFEMCGLASAYILLYIYVDLCGLYSFVSRLQKKKFQKKV
jgi:hypothetical protein